MKVKRVYLLLFGALPILCSEVHAQRFPCLKKVSVLDNPYPIVNDSLNNMAYVNVREADVMWSKRIWRKIDLREKINLPLYYPLQPSEEKMNMFEVIKCAVLNGETSVYEVIPSDLDDCFSVALTTTEKVNAFSSEQSIKTSNNEDSTIHNSITGEDIKQYLLKEDWFFDRQRSDQFTRILAICPLKATINSNTGKEDATAGPTVMFWVYFPALRPAFGLVHVFNKHNDAEKRTLDDVFCKRQFSSYIIQESNVYNRTIAAYSKNLDALLESDRIYNDMLNLENDMWQY